MDELVRFLPRFEVPGRAWIEGLAGGEETGAIGIAGEKMISADYAD
jgi:hypothetical protein